MSRFVTTLVLGCLMALGIGTAQAAMTMSPKVQAMVDRHIHQLETWATDSIIVKAVQEQNKSGPLAGMDNRTWKRLRRRSPEIKAFRSRPATRFLRQKREHSGGMISQLVLSASQGEKVAFTNKPRTYLSKGTPAFDQPFESGQLWRGKPKFDTNVQTHVLEVSAPVLVHGKPAGILTMGIQLGHLEKMGKMHSQGMPMKHKGSQ